MKTITQIMEHLWELPDSFKEHCAAGRYHAAAMDYEHALLVSRFVEMGEEPRRRLIASFDAEQVKEAYRKAGWFFDADGEGNRNEAERTGRYVQTLFHKKRVC